MRTRHLIAALAVLLVLSPGAARGGIEKAGTTAANFLSVGADAALLGMGGAALGVGGDLGAAAWNPAALGSMDQLQVLFAHADLSNQDRQEWASVGGPGGTLGMHWALNGLFQSDGGIDGRDASNNPTGTFGTSSSAFGLQLARPLGPNFSAGLGAKYVNEKLAGVSGSGATFDAGLSMRSGMLGFGVVAQNVLGRMTYDTATYPFPSSVGCGVSLTDPARGLRVALDANVPAAYYPDIRGGIEWLWKGSFALRAGYRAELGAAPGDPLAGPTFGMGAGVSGFWIDYGYLMAGGGNGQHRLGLSFHPGGSESAAGTTGGGSPSHASATADRDARRPASGATSPAARPSKIVVGKGETLEIIARRWGTSVSALMMLNNLSRPEVRPGQVLILPRK
jgi:hypothetical protein